MNKLTPFELFSLMLKMREIAVWYGTYSFRVDNLYYMTKSEVLAIDIIAMAKWDDIFLWSNTILSIPVYRENGLRTSIINYKRWPEGRKGGWNI